MRWSTERHHEARTVRLNRLGGEARLVPSTDTSYPMPAKGIEALFVHGVKPLTGSSVLCPVLHTRAGGRRRSREESSSSLRGHPTPRSPLQRFQLLHYQSEGATSPRKASVGGVLGFDLVQKCLSRFVGVTRLVAALCLPRYAVPVIHHALHCF